MEEAKVQLPLQPPGSCADSTSQTGQLFRPPSFVSNSLRAHTREFSVCKSYMTSGSGNAELANWEPLTNGQRLLHWVSREQEVSKLLMEEGQGRFLFCFAREHILHA